MKKYMLNPFVLFLIGLGLGVISRVFDIYFATLGNIFSQMAIWILLGTLIAIFSKTKKMAMINILPFCMGMLITYLFAFCSPVLAFFAWMTKEKGWFPKIISVGIVSASIMSSILLFERLRIYDLIIDAVLIYFLFFKKIKRAKSN